MQNRNQRIVAVVLLGAFATGILAGCGSKDVDPGAKVDAPGYYNGPMKPRGGGGDEGKEGGEKAGG